MTIPPNRHKADVVASEVSHATPLARLLEMLRAADVWLEEPALAAVLTHLRYEPVIDFLGAELREIPNGDAIESMLLVMPPPVDFCLKSERRAGLLAAVGHSGAISVMHCPLPKNSNLASPSHVEWVNFATDSETDVEIASVPLIFSRTGKNQPVRDVFRDLQSTWRGAMECTVLPSIRDPHPKKSHQAKAVIKRWATRFVPSLLQALQRVEVCEFTAREVALLYASKLQHPAIRPIDLDMISMRTAFDRDSTMPRYVPSLQHPSLFEAADHFLERLKKNHI
jgi:hypothetical protein